MKYVVVGFVLVGVLLFSISGYIFYSNRNFALTAVEKTGVVVDYESSGRRSRGMAPVIEYQANDGAFRLYYHNVYTTPPAYEIGEKVKILVNPNEDRDVRIKGESIVFWILFGLGFIFTAFGVVFFFAFRKEL